MSERPLLRLPNPATSRRASGPRRPIPRPPSVPPETQKQRDSVGGRFQILEAALSSSNPRLTLQNNAAAIAPERAIVFEVQQGVDEFIKVAEKLGMEYLAEDESDAEEEADLGPGGRLYMVMPTLESLRQLLSLWNRWQTDQILPRGFTPWREIFGYLRTVRPWGPEDRLPRETRTYITEVLELNPDASIRLECEMWFRVQASERKEAETKFTDKLTSLEGFVISKVEVPDIRYHAVLVEIPAHRARHLLSDPENDLASVPEVMCIEPQSSLAILPQDQASMSPNSPDPPLPESLAPPVAALFDGFPVQNHRLLENRLIIDDPDDYETTSLVSRRIHGTEMASLIIHGDRNINSLPIGRYLYVRPVMVQCSDPMSNGQEEFPRDRMVLDLLYQSVMHIKENDDPDLRGIFLCNLSLGDRNRPFAGSLSAWARLLDFLSYKYKILFIVAAGNVLNPIELTGFQGLGGFESATAEEKLLSIFRAWNDARSLRTLFSPAEAMNVLTIGAWHKDNTTDPLQAAMALDPFPDNDLPNLSSGLGHGYRRIVKPDLYLEGGSEPVQYAPMNGSITLRPSRIAGQKGLRAAAPDPGGQYLDREELVRGTSAATALATRTAIQIHDQLMVAEQDGPFSDMPEEFKAVTIKALLVHSASWDTCNERLIDFINSEIPQYPHNRDTIGQFLGWGKADASRAVECLEDRVTLVGYGSIACDEAKTYEIPLPPSLSGTLTYRSVTVTVAWLSPINVLHRGYRVANLTINKVTDRFGLGVSRVSAQPSHNSLQRGTVYHERLEGEQAVAFLEGDNMTFAVECSSKAGRLTEEVPYAIAVSIEVAANAGIDVYTEVRDRVMIKPQAN